MVITNEIKKKVLLILQLIVKGFEMIYNSNTLIFV